MTTNSAKPRRKPRRKLSRQAKQEKRAKLAAMGIVAVLIVGIIASGVMLALQPKPPTIEIPATQQYVPSRVQDDGSYLVAAEDVSDSAKRVDLFFDPMCPGCGIVDRGIGERLAQLVDDGEIRLHLFPVSFLDDTSTDMYSTRAVNAFMTVAEHDPRIGIDFLHQIYKMEFQPKEGGHYVPVSTELLAGAAMRAGAPEAIVNEIYDYKYTEFIAENSERQMDRSDLFKGRFTTPSIFIGVDYNDDGTVNGEAAPVQMSAVDPLGSFNDALESA